jgi:hypothetical protein
MNELDLFYFQQEEPFKRCFSYLRKHILNYDEGITEAWKFNMPFFCHNGQMFCYFHIYKKDGVPYIGFTEGKRIDHPALVRGDRDRIKILPLDPTAGVPTGALNGILKEAIHLCKTGL